MTTFGGWRHGAYKGDCSIEELFKAIWKRAEKERKGAERISFVGISFHPYLDGAFRHLFSACPSSTNLELVFANESLRGLQDSPRGKVFRRRVRGLFPSHRSGELNWRFHPDFKTFIESEL